MLLLPLGLRSHSDAALARHPVKTSVQQPPCVPSSALPCAWQTVYEEMEVDAEMQRGLLPGGLALSAKFVPALRAVAFRTVEVTSPAVACGSDTRPRTRQAMHVAQVAAGRTTAMLDLRSVHSTRYRACMQCFSCKRLVHCQF